MSNNAEYRRRLYEVKRLVLVALLGGKCRYCGTKDSLEFHHPKGRTWDSRKPNRLHRIVLWYRDLAANNLELACRRCNARIGNPLTMTNTIANSPSAMTDDDTCINAW
jgi:5-methylcytosine-specific restriction endonuclease McrA